MTIALSQVSLSSESLLLLSLARDKLSSANEKAATGICQEVRDWELVQRRALQHFILPTVYRHLSSLPAANVPDTALKAMRAAVLPVVANSLKIAGAQRQFSDTVLKPSQIRHAFVKGQALAGYYYANPGSRFCRDVDLLVERAKLVEVCERAQERGYRVFPDRRLMNRRDLGASAKYRPVQSLISPGGVLFEVHSELDKTGLLFSTRKLLESAESKEIHGSVMAVLPTAKHFVFVCLHSTRHLWSHLSWLVDMDAMIRHASFDLNQVREFAEKCGALETVDACMELYRACASDDPGRAGLSVESQDLFDAMAMHLEEGPKIEFALRVNRPLPDYSFNWQAGPAYRLRAGMSQRLDFLRPSFKDYEAFPLPAGLQWLYYLSRPFSGLLRRRARESANNES